MRPPLRQRRPGQHDQQADSAAGLPVARRDGHREGYRRRNPQRGDEVRPVGRPLAVLAGKRTQRRRSAVPQGHHLADAGPPPAGVQPVRHEPGGTPQGFRIGVRAEGQGPPDCGQQPAESRLGAASGPSQSGQFRAIGQGALRGPRDRQRLRRDSADPQARRRSESGASRLRPERRPDLAGDPSRQPVPGSEMR